MPLPIVTLKNDEKWDCHQCGYCCRGSIVPLSKEDEERLRSQKWAEEPEYKSTQFMVPHRSAASSYRLAHREDGTCVFLSENGLCRIHAKFGLEAKPTTCRMFPMQLIPHEKHAVLTYRRACPSAGADRGSVAKDHLSLVKRMVNDGELRAEPINPPKLKYGESRDWKTIRSVLEIAGSVLRDERYPPVRRLVHALQFAHNLDAAKTRSLSDDKIVELARTLADLMPEEATPFFKERKITQKNVEGIVSTDGDLLCSSASAFSTNGKLACSRRLSAHFVEVLPWQGEATELPSRISRGHVRGSGEAARIADAEDLYAAQSLHRDIVGVISVRDRQSSRMVGHRQPPRVGAAVSDRYVDAPVEIL